MQKPEQFGPIQPDSPVVLIVDDEEMVRRFAQTILEGEGFHVLTADNGEAALWISRRYYGPIHFLLTDVVMPRMGGVELTNLLLAERPTVCIILMSGHIFAQDIDPKFPILQKPFSPKQLMDTLTALVPSCHGAPEVV